MIKTVVAKLLRYINSHRLATVVLCVAITYQIAKIAHCDLIAGEPIRLLATSIVEVTIARFVGE